MSSHEKFLKITGIVQRQFSPEVVTALQNLGIEHIYTTVGRTPMLNESRGISALLNSQGSLSSMPIEVLSCYVTEAHEDSVISTFARHGRLQTPGMGSVYTESMTLDETHALCNPSHKNMQTGNVAQIKTHADLVGISCVVQRGQADILARKALELGAGVPTITFGTGTGVRDKLGLLRITIPAEKEVITLVVNPWDAEAAMHAMIEAGHLDQPGKGFINNFPVRRGILNTKLSSGNTWHAASMEQIIAAVDHLSGNMEWRRDSSESQTTNQALRFFKVRDLSVVCNEGQGVGLVKAAMNAGCGGATIEKLKLFHNQSNSAPTLSPVREVCKLMIPDDKRNAIIAAMNAAGALNDESQAMIYHGAVTEGFTYSKRA